MQKAHKVNLTFQLKRGTAARWVEMNPVLADGEPGFELDTNQLKIGNGKDVWTNLPYLTDAASLVTEEELANAIDIAKEEILNQSGLYELNYDKTANEIKLTNKNTGEVSTISTLDFIKDGMIKEVRLSSSGKELVITWNTDAGKESTRISLANFIDIYTSKNTDTVNMSVDNKVFSAQVNPESLNNSHLTPNANIAASKLSQEVRDDLARAATAVQPEALGPYALAEETKREMDNIFASVQYNNCLKNHDPSRIKMEYTNRAGGWKASIKDENTGEEIHGASLFSRHQIEGWDEHSIDFVNESTTDAMFRIYSVSTEPGVIQVDDIKIQDLSGNGLYHEPQCSPNDFDAATGVWETSWASRRNTKNQVVVSVSQPTWSGYVTGRLNLTPGASYYVDVNILPPDDEGATFEGGVNFSVRDATDKKLTGRYLSSIGKTRFYFVATTENITLYFGGSGTVIDNLIIDSCVVYQSSFTRWSSTSPIMDGGWVEAADWYDWGIETDYEGRRVVRFCTSKENQKWYTKQRALTLDTHTHYHLSFKSKCVSGGLNLQVRDANNKDNVIIYQTISTEVAPEWTKFDFSFVPTVENCILQIQDFGDPTIFYDTYMSDLYLEPIATLDNILCNSDFTNDKYAGGIRHVGRANWTLGKASSIVDGTAQLSVPSGNSLTYVSGCSQVITLIPGNRYRVSFRSKSIEHTPLWMPYITFTNEDKKAFMADWKEPKYEDLVFGGPWVKGSAERYAARVTIEGNMPINAKYLCVDAGIWGSESFEVDVKIKQNEELIYFNKHELVSPYNLGNYAKFYLPLPENFVYDSQHSIELTFMVNETDNSEYPNQIRSINILGNFVISNHKSEPDYYMRPDGKMVAPTLIAERIVTNIDDGSLDWEV